jgi:hypothetical protein
LCVVPCQPLDALGVPPEADSGTIKKAYRKKSMKYHPDRPTGDEEKFKMASAAYEILMDDEKRRLCVHGTLPLPSLCILYPSSSFVHCLRSASSPSLSLSYCAPQIQLSRHRAHPVLTLTRTTHSDCPLTTLLPLPRHTLTQFSLCCTYAFDRLCTHAPTCDASVSLDLWCSRGCGRYDSHGEEGLKMAAGEGGMGPGGPFGGLFVSRSVCS